MTSWQPIETAPKDGTWIVGFCGGETIYIVMRWWDGVLPEEEDDFSTDEVGNWVVSGDVKSEGVKHWMPFTPHPSAPPKTVSLYNTDGIDGVRHLPRAERGLTEDQIMWSCEFQCALVDLQNRRDLSAQEAVDMAAAIAEKAVPGGRW